MKSFARAVRSKSPFRRRKRAEVLISEIRQKEAQYVEKNIRNNRDDDIALPEIEVVLSPPPMQCFPSWGHKESDWGQKDGTKQPSRKGQKGSTKPTKKNNETLREVKTSSTSGTDEPAPNSKDAAKRNKQKQTQTQKKPGAANQRRSFRDRFMRPYKQPPPPPPSRPKTSKQRGVRINVPNQKAKKSNTKTQERGRSLTRRPKEAEKRAQSEERRRSRTRSATGQSKGKAVDDYEEKKSTSNRIMMDPLLDYDQEGKQLPVVEHAVSARKLVTIELGQMSRVSELSTPAAIFRQESLCNESISGVRQALQKIEQELGKASNDGKRVSRRKIMNALNFMADSLHHEEEKKVLAKELDAWIDESVMGATNPGVRVDIDDEEDDSEDESESSTDSSSTFNLEGYEDTVSKISTVKTREQTDLTFPDVMNRLEKCISDSRENHKAVETGLSDFVWKMLLGDTSGQPRDNRRLRHVEEETNESLETSDSEESLTDEQTSFDPFVGNERDLQAMKRNRSWWRKHRRETKKVNASPVRASSNSHKKSVASRSKSKSKKSESSSSRSKSSKKKKPITSNNMNQPARFAMEESDKDTLDYTSSPVETASESDKDNAVDTVSLQGSEFWRHGDPYKAHSNSNSNNIAQQQVNYAGNYKLAYTSSARPDFEKEFLQSAPDGDDDFDNWEDSCLHSVENYNGP